MTSLARLASMARRFGALERRLFEVLGGWVPTVTEPEAKVLLRAHSFQHAWHGQLWDELAPHTGAVEKVEEGPGGVAAELVTVVDVISGEASTVGRLVGAYRVVLPRLVQGYGELGEGLRPATDGPLARALGLMLADDRAAQAAGESLLQASLGTTEEAEDAIAHLDRLEGVRRTASGVEADDERR